MPSSPSGLQLLFAPPQPPESACGEECTCVYIHRHSGLRVSVSWGSGPSPGAIEPARLKAGPCSWVDQHIDTCKGCTVRLAAGAFSGPRADMSSVNCTPT